MLIEPAIDDCDLGDYILLEHFTNSMDYFFVAILDHDANFGDDIFLDSSSFFLHLLLNDHAYPISNFFFNHLSHFTSYLFPHYAANGLQILHV